MKHRLTKQQLRYLVCLADGLSCKETAEAMKIAIGTSVRHRRELYARTGKHSIALLTKLALRLGLTKL